MRSISTAHCWRLVCSLICGCALASPSHAQFSGTADGGQAVDSSFQVPRALAPAHQAAAEPLAGLPPTGETLPRADMDANPYRQPAYGRPSHADNKTAPFEAAHVRELPSPADSVESAAFGQPGPVAQTSLESPPLPLKLPGEAKKLPKPESVAVDGRPASGLPSMLTVFVSLFLVLIAFFALTWFMRRGMPNRLATLPTEVVEVLGRSTLATRNQMHLIRVGNKLLLVSVTPTGAETLTEITDPVEVDRLGSICSQRQPSGITQSFRGVLEDINREAESGRGMTANVSGSARSRSPLFAKLSRKGTVDDA